MQLFETIQSNVQKWRESGYASDYSALAEILEHATLPETQAFRFLRKAQFKALETYWYLRLGENTPHIFDLYQKSFPKRSDLMDAIGIHRENPEIADLLVNEGWDELLRRIRTDDEFVKRHHLESLRESLTLDYPSYILALAMGAGKTILIGSIIATEFAMALEYPDAKFIKNALVFAPGKTIFTALREIADIRFQQILPPRLHKPFAANLKLTFTRDGEKDLPIIRGSAYNLVVTNTEKIRIQKPTVRASKGMTQLELERREEEEGEIANLRLQAIASLPNLGIFSDEAHHTYGQEMESELKKVRKTVDYLHQNTDVICVVNTTGTPYFKRQPLKDVVIWYGLAEGIRDNILKQVSGNIKAYSFDAEHADEFLHQVVTDFFKQYADVITPDGSPAKLAIYFPQESDLTELRSAIEKALIGIGQSPSIVTQCTYKSGKEEQDAFDNFRFSSSPHRIALLVNKGAEGWDCPSLFACALVRRLKDSNNFVLQTSTRCLRQIKGNTHKASIYLFEENVPILERQLQETYGETIADLNNANQNTRTQTLTLKKINLPPLVVKMLITKVVLKAGFVAPLIEFDLPRVKRDAATVTTFTLDAERGKGHVLADKRETLEMPAETIDVYSLAVDLAGVYRLAVGQVYAQLKNLYGANTEIPVEHRAALAKQIEEQTRNYEITREQVEVALALVKPDGFDKKIESGNIVYTTDIVYPVDREELLWRFEQAANNRRGLGFHYTPYNFDSKPEKSFFELMLNQLNTRLEDVEDIFFTGALTNPAQTDFFVEYQTEDGAWHRYTPDFIIRKKNGKCLIVEIKKEHDCDHAIDGEKGRKAMKVREWEQLDPERLKYQMIFTDSEMVPFDHIQETVRLIEEQK